MTESLTTVNIYLARQSLKNPETNQKPTELNTITYLVKYN